jgi:hypothetical protein
MLAQLPILVEQTSTSQKVVKLCYEFSFLSGRKRAGLRLTEKEELKLKLLAQLLADSDPRSRRSQWRYPMLLQVTLRTPTGSFPATLLNINGEGMYIKSSIALAINSKLQVRLALASRVEYAFPCSVRWQGEGNKSAGLCFEGIPLEIRFG